MTSGNGDTSVIHKLKLQGRLPYAATKSALDASLGRLADELRFEAFTVVPVAPSIVGDRASAEDKGGS
jgi:NAD(P)-dependent dehydrogenase (short-subunit alcohol dehydrogenase family)